MKLDTQGNVYATGPGGVWVFTPDGKHLGTIKPPETPANCGWGDDGKTLYMTARTGLYRIKLAAMGQKLGWSPERAREEFQSYDSAVWEEESLLHRAREET